MKNLLLIPNLCINVFSDYKFYIIAAVAFGFAVCLAFLKSKLIKAAAKKATKKQK